MSAKGLADHIGGYLRIAADQRRLQTVIRFQAGHRAKRRIRTAFRYVFRLGSCFQIAQFGARWATIMVPVGADVSRWAEHAGLPAAVRCVRDVTWCCAAADVTNAASQVMPARGIRCRLPRRRRRSLWMPRADAAGVPDRPVG